MISVVGLGNAGSAVAEKFSDLPQYNVYTLNDKVKRTSKYSSSLRSMLRQRSVSVIFLM